MDVDAKDAYSK